MTEADTIRRAIAGRTPGSGQYAGVRAGDVVAVASAIPPAAHTKVTRSLLQGAAGAAEDAEVYQVADQLAQLLDAAGLA